VDQRVPWIIGALIESQAIFPGGHKVGRVLWGQHPPRVEVRLEEVFLRVCRTVS